MHGALPRITQFSATVYTPTMGRNSEYYLYLFIGSQPLKPSDAMRAFYNKKESVAPIQLHFLREGCEKDPNVKNAVTATRLTRETLHQSCTFKKKTSHIFSYKKSITLPVSINCGSIVRSEPIANIQLFLLLSTFFEVNKKNNDSSSLSVPL